MPPSPSPPEASPPALAGPGPKSRALAERLRKVETANVTWLSDDFPVFWEKGAGVYIEDVDGGNYLDMTAAFGVGALGHAPPETSSALQAQSDRLVHGMGDVHPSAIKVELLERLAALVPVEDPRITLGTGGSMATEIALKAMRLSSGRTGVLAFEGGYHGLTLGALSVVGHERFLTPFHGLARPGLPRAPFPDTRNPPAGCRDDNVGAHALETAASIMAAHKDEIGAVIIEPIQGRGGIRIPPPGFLSELQDLCRDRNLIFICDEIFTGFYRTGPRFACLQEKLSPDILLVGKALGGGMPIGACVGRRTVMDAFGPSTGEAIHTETFLGHPATMAVALSTLDRLEQGSMREQVLARGETLKTILEETLSRHELHFTPPFGRGLMWGVGCLEEGEPAPHLLGKLMRIALGCGLILLGGGVRGNILEFTPALTITDGDLAEMAVRLDRAVRSVLGSH